MRFGFAVLALVFSTCTALRAEAPASNSVETEKKALSPFKGLVGEWRGAGQPSGGGPTDSWTEEPQWSWQFKGGHAALAFECPKGKYFSAGKLEPADKAGQFRFTGTPAAGKTPEIYNGELNKDGDLELKPSAAAGANRPDRLTLSIVAKGKRMVIDYEKRERGEHYAKFAEVGFTLKGSGFGRDADMHECVVTGGVGKMTVTYKGQTYYVCCGGCRDLFNENPEKELAEFKKRKEEEKKRD